MWETWVRSLGWEDPLEKGKESDMTEWLVLHISISLRCTTWWLFLHVSLNDDHKCSKHSSSHKNKGKSFSYGENSEFKNIHIYYMSLLTLVIMLYIAAQNAGWTPCPQIIPCGKQVTEPNLGPLAHAQYNVPTPGCCEEKGSLRKVPDKESRAASAQKAWAARGFQQSTSKGKVREGCPRVIDQLRHDFLIGGWWGNRAASQDLMSLRCQEVLGLHAHGH